MQPPVSSEAPPSELSEPRVDPILTAFRGSIQRPSTSPLYGIWLSIVAVIMLILPLIYLSLVLLTVYGVYFYATEFYDPIMNLPSRRGRGLILKLFLYGGPLFVGAVLVFFLIKPLFAGRPARAQPYALNPEAEPALFAFIAKICEVVGAPMPRRIDLDCNLNAAAGFRRGLWSLFGNDLVLTIGLPLVAGLSMREFAGVLAHEFGHFTQGMGMRLTYVIRSVNFWFARVVYERDAWDVTLQEWGASEDWRIAILVGFARFGVWISRGILTLLMLFGNLISSFMLRQMEYDADAYEIKVAGSEAFETTTRRMAILNELLNASYKEMRAQWNTSHRLPDNLPAYLFNKVSEAPDALKQKIDDELGFDTTGPFDTHPSATARIQRARAANEPGIFAVEEPASTLFQNFQVPARFVTLLHYNDDLDLPVGEESLVMTKMKTDAPAAPPAATAVPNAPPAEMASSGALDVDVRAVLQRYFFGLEPILRPILLAPSDLAEPAHPANAILTIKTMSSRLAPVRPALEEACRRFAADDEKLMRATQALYLIEAGFKIDPVSFQLSAPTLVAAQQSLEQALEDRARVIQKLESVGAELKSRLACSLALTATAPAILKLENCGKYREEAHRLVNFLSTIGEAFKSLDELRREQAALHLLLQFKSNGGPEAGALAAHLSNHLTKLLNDLLQKVGSLTCPVGPQAGKISVARYLLAQPLASSEPETVAREAAIVHGRLNLLYETLIAELAVIAEKVEAIL